MKRTIKLLTMFALPTLLGMASFTFTGCKDANADNPAAKVETTELIRTSQSWDGVELPDYFAGRPELVAMKYVFPAGQKLGWHHHVAMNYGVLVQGELTIGADALSYYDEATSGWRTEAGKYEALIGTASNQLPVKYAFTLK